MIQLLSPDIDSGLIESSINPRLATIWAIVEARVPNRAVIVVASATEFDDTETIARGFCQASQEAGKRTGYLALRSGRFMAHTSNEPGELVLPVRESARQSLDAALPGWRSAYDIIVVDVPELTTSTLGAHIASIADGVVVALYPDRRVKPADSELKMLLSQLGTSIIGVVRTSRPKDIPKPKLSKAEYVRSRLPSIRRT
jgi:hypothetical protein